MPDELAAEMGTLIVAVSAAVEVLRANAEFVAAQLVARLGGSGPAWSVSSA